jgi:L-threonylcarbamoyladenylate synthase
MADIARAVEILRRGGVVAFATETVYGLGADATSAAAVRSIFQLKGRPANNPLIVHVADEESATRWAADWPAAAGRLAAEFWPGPISLVVKKSASIVDEATAGKATVALRAPNHPLALELLRTFGGPIAAPSANRSDHVSPTTADHVRQEFGDALELILDGGPCEVGIESTVIDLSEPVPMILRPGRVTRGQIEAVIGPVRVFSGSIEPHLAASSPGQQKRHYAPTTKAFRFDSKPPAEVAGFGLILMGGNECNAQRSTLNAQRSSGERQQSVTIELPGEPGGYAREFYAALRRLDQMHLTAIYIQLPPDKPVWAAVRDRIIRATSPS